MTLLDRFNRPLRSLRISVTDRCNLRCQYCMPEPEYLWLPRENILSFEEVATLADAFTDEGVNRVRITGGEPLLRRDLPVLIESLAGRPAVEDLALTTNGILLRAQAAALKRAGLHRITVSLDSLRRERFRALTGSSDFDAVMAGIHAAADTFADIKIDSVMIRGTNEDELIDLIEFGRTVLYSTERPSFAELSVRSGQNEDRPARRHVTCAGWPERCHIGRCCSVLASTEEPIARIPSVRGDAGSRSSSAPKRLLRSGQDRPCAQRTTTPGIPW